MLSLKRIPNIGERSSEAVFFGQPENNQPLMLRLEKATL